MLVDMLLLIHRMGDKIIYELSFDIQGETTKIFLHS